jgi:hypothetical protein
MHELAELARLREDVPPARTDRAYQQLARAVAGSTRAAGSAGAPRPASRASARKLAIAMSAAVAVLAVAITAAVMGLPGTRPAATGAARPAAPPWPATQAELAALATKAATRCPRFGAPSPKDWAYTDVLQTQFPGLPKRTIQFWQQIGSGHAAQMVDGRLRTNVTTGADGARLAGWPGSVTALYGYLASLPASPAALRAVILANTSSDRLAGAAAYPRIGSSAARWGGQAVAAFNAIQVLLLDLAVPPRLQAELIAVAASLPGARFDREVTDTAGRHGVGLYMLDGEGGFLQELIFNPVTCTYLGAQWIEVRARTGYGTSHEVVRYERGAIIDRIASLDSGIVQRAGQFPGR